MASLLCFQMFSILCGLLSRLEVSHVTGNIFMLHVQPVTFEFCQCLAVGSFVK